MRPDAERTVRSQEVYEAIRSDIIFGRLKPGTRLLEKGICQKTNFGRTPVREAMRRLETQGLVAHRPRLGAVVRELSYSEIIELSELMSSLEGAAGALATKNASESQVMELERISAKMMFASGMPNSFLELDLAFHRIVWEAARNRYLLRSLNKSEALMRLARAPINGCENSIKTYIIEHDAILTHIKTGDAEGAKSMLIYHMERLTGFALKAMRDDSIYHT